jgi:hypothetical protein
LSTRRSLAACALLGALLAPLPLAAQASPAPQPAPPAKVALDYDSLAFGRQVTDWFYGGQTDSLWAHTDPGMRAQMSGGDEWSRMLAELIGRAGGESELVEERWMLRGGHRQYVRIFNAVTFTDDKVVLRWALGPGKTILGAGLNPLSQMPAADPE